MGSNGEYRGGVSRCSLVSNGASGIGMAVVASYGGSGSGSARYGAESSGSSGLECLVEVG